MSANHDVRIAVQQQRAAEALRDEAIRLCDQLRALLNETIEVICGEFCGVNRHHPTCVGFTVRRDALLGKKGTR
jgi:hypothetical protein